MKKKCLLLGMLLSTVTAMMGQNWRESVYLKNGSIIKGIVLEQTANGTIKIQTADGSLFVYPMGDVLKITKEEYNQESLTNMRTGKNKRAIFDKGYRGMVDLTLGIGVGADGDNLIGISTSHGYQFNPYIYLGGGVALNFNYPDYHIVQVPVFAHLRANFMKTSIAPYADIKMGISMSDSNGFYLAQTVGVRFNLDEKKGMRLGIGYTLQQSGEYNYYYDDAMIGSLDIKVGFEF
ncbi:MAG: hypothetical protein RR346_03575 [Bacteroidales bacterium]